MRFWIPTVLLSTFWIASMAPKVHAMQDYYVGVGPSVAYLHGATPEAATALGLDLTLGQARVRPCSQCMLPSVAGVWWVSAGVRAAGSNLETLLPYAEFGTWSLLTLGVGYGSRVTGSAWDHYAQGFLGIPIPVLPLGKRARLRRFIFLEPYYRPGWRLWSGGALHELGVLVKVAFRD